jgi:hypothetical protein
MLQRKTIAIRTFGKILVEVDSAARKTLCAAIRILTFCDARWIAASPNLLLRTNQGFDVEYCEDLWFHDVFLISECVAREQFLSLWINPYLAKLLASASSDLAVDASIEGNVAGGYPPGKVFRDSKLATLPATFGWR